MNILLTSWFSTYFKWTLVNREYNKPTSVTIEKEDILSGDFNGDNITDVLIIERNLNDFKAVFLNLDSRLQDNYISVAGSIEGVIKANTIIKTGDVNGDGKTDLIVFRGYNYSGNVPYNDIKVYTLGVDNTLINITNFSFSFPYDFGNQSTLVGYSTNGIKRNPIIIGDYNGDGKNDFLLPGDSRVTLYSTGTSFIAEPLSSLFPAFADMGVMMPGDFNGDGKTDIVRLIKTREAESQYDANGNLITSSPFIFTYINLGISIDLLIKNGVNNPTGWSSTNFRKIFSDPEYYETAVVPEALSIFPIFLRQDKKFSDGRLELAIFDGNNKIKFFTFQNQVANLKSLQKIVLGNNVTESITYSTLNNTNGIYTSAGQIENYPNFDLGTTNSFRVVSQLERYNTTVYNKQLYSYAGAVTNLEGLGFLGFRSVLKTNWFDNDASSISTITKYDISKRGAPVESFSVLGIASPTLTLLPTDSFISRNQVTYNNENGVYENPLQPNKVFKLKKTLSKNSDGLLGISTETTTNYNVFNNPTQINTLVKKGSLSEQSSTTIFQYYPPLTSPYIIDTPKSKTTTATLLSNNDTTSSEELYIYDKNLLKQFKKKGYNTDYIIEDNDYDAYGNIIKKTISATSLTPRTQNYEYDVTSHRFLIKETDFEGIPTLYTYDTSNGWLLTKTLPVVSPTPLVVSYAYDKWGKKIQTTDHLGKIETNVYENFGDDILITTSAEDGSSSTKLIDTFGRTIREGVKNINDNWSYVDAQYDSKNRTIFKSQPYSTAIEVWNETHYDVYGRIEQAIALKSNNSQGKVVNFSYSGLIATENDGQKTKQTISNALGNVISLTETPGGTITYDYFANGNLKSSTFNNASTIIEQDGWGRKKTLIDPSAGTRKYEYNAFGELTKETVVNKGITNYDINATGKINFKTITDLSGNVKSKNTYTYDPTTKLLKNIRFDDYVAGFFTQNNYLYDDYNRLVSNEEIADQRATFIKTTSYDDFGRPAYENFYAQNKSDGKSSSKSITNSYKNGYKWQIIDNDTGLALWETNTVNAQGQVLTATLGNGITTSNTYDIYGFPTQIKNDTQTTNIMTLNTVFDPVYGNLLSRTNNMFDVWNESFTYDNSDRLKSYKDVSGIQTQTYNENGTILNNNLGAYAYTITNKPYQVSSITPLDQSVSSPVLNYYNNREQNITYNLFKSPVTITEQNKENIDFEYNAFNGRSAMYYGGLQTVKNQRPYFKFYSADGTMEIKRKITSPSNVEFITYIGGDAYTAPVIVKSDGTTQNLFYLHRDYQGTITAITNSAAVVVEKRLFDVWGSLIKYANNAGVNTVPTTAAGLFIDRGYTSHEHLLGIGLINMNGRIYDPKLHRFLQPDNNIQDLTNTQNYNRYSYVMNNPTKYTDPSGESFIGYILGYLFSTYIHGAQATGQANPFHWNSAGWTNAFLGSTSSAISSAATNLSNYYIDNYQSLQQNFKTFEANPYVNYSKDFAIGFAKTVENIVNPIKLATGIVKGIINDYKSAFKSAEELSKGKWSFRNVINSDIGVIGQSYRISSGIYNLGEQAFSGDGKAGGTLFANIAIILLTRQAGSAVAVEAVVAEEVVAVESSTALVSITEETFSQALFKGAESSGGYSIYGTKGLVGTTFNRNIFLLEVESTSVKSLSGFRSFVKGLETEAVGSGANKLSIYGEAVINNGFLNPNTATRFGYSFEQSGAGAFFYKKL